MARPPIVAISESERTAYEGLGCEVLAGRLGGQDAAIVFTPYAQQRMRERDIDPEEVLDLLSRPLSSHERGQVAHRREVAAAIGPRRIRVVYERPTVSIVKVITAHQD